VSGDLHAQVVEAAAVPGVLQQDEFQWGIGDREVGVAGTQLGRFGAEQLAVEGDSLVEVADVEGELHTTGHRASKARADRRL
jgi:hypothetical protein